VRSTKVTLSKIFLILLIYTQCSFAKGPINTLALDTDFVSDNKRIQKSNLSLLTINPALLALHEQLKENKEDFSLIESNIAQLTLSKVPLNPAERYLLLVAQALIIIKTNGIHVNNSAIIQLLEQTKLLSDQISDQQLSQPNFLQRHLLLASYYAKKKKYDLAYLEKKTYLKKYSIYRKNKRLAMIDSLEQSFEVKDKKANNALLESENKSKVSLVAEVQKQRASQKYNFTLIISAAIVFLIIFFRQLIICNKLIRLTRKDGLTGLENRNALFEHGEKMVASFSKKPQELSLLLLDLDNFKRINDSFGHQVGDNVLVVVSQLVNETMRSRDVFYRLGGEEFVAILPFADNNKAKAIAKRINEKIVQHDFTPLILRGTVTVSIGVATMEHNKLTFDDILHCADLAMYQAKEEGRNSVVCYHNIAVSQERRAN
jgi:diguanylate cyclase (GGDEF)-like protein